MKLRAKGDSLRLRVVRAELAALQAGDAVEERVGFPGGAELVYRLVIAPGATAFEATYADGTLTVAIPGDEARRWFEPTAVGVRGELALGGGRTLGLLIEKDFPCLTERPGEDDSDAFPWPEAPPRC